MANKDARCSSADDKGQTNEEGLVPRETWSNKIQFLFGCIGFSVGLGNVWRFPYLCYRDGGGAFLIPYILCVIVGAIPMFVLEIAIGQYTSQGAITCWNLVPLFKGIGYASQFAMSLGNIYYNVVLGWSFYYLFASFTKTLPWSTCDNSWNTLYCRKAAHVYTNLDDNVTSFLLEFSRPTEGEDPEVRDTRDRYMSEVSQALGHNMSDVDLMLMNGSVLAVDPVTEYWQRQVLAISDGVEDLGTVKWDLALCLLLAWVVVYFCIWKGIKWTGKIMYVSTTSPYIIMCVLLIRGVTLPGALDGIKYYLYPDVSKLLNLQVWYGAASQVFFSYSMGVGSLTALGSYNKFHHNFWKDSLLFACINSGTSFLAGFIIFSVLGFMAHEHHVNIDQVAESGPGLVFIAYPKAVAELPGAPVWSVLFFTMLILLGMDSQFGCVEGFTTAVIDVFPKYLRRKHMREIFVAALCFGSFLVGLTMCTNGGIYVFLLFDYYCQARSIILIAFFECIAISWFYGVNRFYDNIETMLGWRLWPHLKVCWAVITPAFNLGMSILCVYNYSEVTYNRTYHYPKWAIGCGWLMSFSSVSFIPLVMVWKMAWAKGSFIERYRYLTSSQVPPREEERESELKNGPLNGDPHVTVQLLSMTTGPGEQPTRV